MLCMLRWLLKFSVSVSAFLAVLFLPGILLILCLEAEVRGRSGHAPQADFATRREWGERLYRPYLEYMDSWAALSPLIRSDVGDVQRIAPIGFNRYQGGFTDGAYAAMNLEVIGTHGTGILHLPYVEIWDNGQLNSIGESAKWTCNGKTEIITNNGKGYLNQLGLEDKYTALLDLAAANAAEEFMQQFDEFEIALHQRQLVTRRHVDYPQPIESLRDEYREPLLTCLADMAAQQGKSAESAAVYRIAAGTKLKRAQDLLQEPDEQRDMSRIADSLKEVNGLLKLANKQVPDDQRTIRLARQRVELWHLHSVGSRRHAAFVMGDEADRRRAEQTWAEKSLGILYAESARYAMESPFVNDQVPHMKISIYRGGDNRIRVNSHNCYAADVYLQLQNRRSTGTFHIRIRENEDRHDPIDLFSDAPRAPDYPITIRSPYWKPDGGKRVKLSAKTGAPLRASVD